MIKEGDMFPNVAKTLMFVMAILQMAYAEQLIIKSDPPKADLTVRNLGGTDDTQFGSTPYEGSLNELAANYAKANFFIITVGKEGFISQSFVVSDTLKSDISLNISLIPKEDTLAIQKIDKSIAELFEAQRLLRSNQYDQAIALLKTTESTQGNLSVIPEMLGSAYYLKKDHKGALAWYEKAYRINPSNKDAYTMKEYLRKALGISNGKK